MGSGPKGIQDIKTHPFFKNIDWVSIYNKKIKPPFIPKISSDTDTKYIDSVIILNFRNLQIVLLPIRIQQEKVLIILIIHILVNLIKLDFSYNKDSTFK